MRQEPIVYVNGNPVCARPPNKIGEYAELGDVTKESIQADEDEFARMLTKKAEDGGKIKVVDVAKKESELEVKEIITLANVIKAVTEKFPGLKHCRIPICNSSSPGKRFRCSHRRSPGYKRQLSCDCQLPGGLVQVYDGLRVSLPVP